MKVDRILFQGKYSINSQFLDTTLQAEAILEEGETMEEGINQLRDRLNKMADSFRSAGTVSTTFDFSEYHKISDSFNGVTNVIVPQGSTPPKEINLADEKIEIAIDNATTLEELALLKEDCSAPALLKHYMNRLKELTNGTNS